MVTKSKSGKKEAQKKGRIKVGNLKLGKETVRDVTNREAKRIKGGAGPIGPTGPTGQRPAQDNPTGFCNSTGGG